MNSLDIHLAVLAGQPFVNDFMVDVFDDNKIRTDATPGRSVVYLSNVWLMNSTAPVRIYLNYMIILDRSGQRIRIRLFSTGRSNRFHDVNCWE